MTTPRAPHDAPFWCEENAWHLCGESGLGGGYREVVVVTNVARQVALARQRAAPPGRDLVLWDYHVLVFAQAPEGWQAWDLDTTLGWPCPAGLYLAATFPPVKAKYAPRLRPVAAERYRQEFASDRRHMHDGAGGFLQTPPPWPPIGQGHCLPQLLDLADDAWGPWLDLADLAARYGVSVDSSLD